MKNSKINSNDLINVRGSKVVVAERSAYDLWLTENYKNIKIIRTKTIDESHQYFRDGKVEILAGLKPRLLEELEHNDDYKLIEQPFTNVKQSIGVRKGNNDVIHFLNKVIKDLISSKYILESFIKHNVQKKLSIPYI